MSEKEDSPGGSGRGGAMGTPTSTTNTQPPTSDQDVHDAVSGGGMVNKDDETEKKDSAKTTGPSDS